MAVLGHDAPGHLVVTGLEVVGQSNGQLLAVDGELTGGDVGAVDDDLHLGADLLNVSGEGHLEPFGLLVELGTVLGIRGHQLVMGTGRSKGEDTQGSHQQGREAQPESRPP